MTKILTMLFAAMPTYISLFCSGVWAAVVMVAATIFAVFLTGKIDEDVEMIKVMRLVWVIHLTGTMVSIAFHNI